MQNIKFKGITIALSAITILLAGCVANTTKPISNNNTKQDGFIAINKTAEPIIEQDIYIKEAIKQIELNKSKMQPGKKQAFIDEYTYRASDTDSKVTARDKAKIELKKQILDTIGTHITSSLEITRQSNIDKRVRTEIKQVITQYTAGSVSMETMSDKWDGKNFYIKGKILIDPNSVSEGISEGLKAEAERKTIEQLQALVNSQNQSLDLRSNKLTNLQNELSKSLLLTKTKENELLQLKNELAIAKNKLSKYEVEERKTKSELDIIRNTIANSGNKAYNSLVTGMTYNDVKRIAGTPRSITDCSNTTYYNYGRVWVIFRDGITTGWVHTADWSGPCSSYKGIISAKERAFATTTNE